MKHDDNENNVKSKPRRVIRVALWSALAVFVLVVVIPLLIGGYMYIATPGPPEQLTAMVEACEKRGENCPKFLAKFRAYQQIYLADVDVAKKFVPPDVELLSLFGYTPSALFVVEYTYMSYDDPPTAPAGNTVGAADALYREVDVLQLAAKGPDGMIGAWASHVLVTHPKMLLGRGIGLPAEIAPEGITIEHNCDKNKSGIVFDVGPWGKNAGPDRVRKIKVCLPLGPGQGTMDLTVLKNHNLPNLTGRIMPDKAYVYGAGPHKASELGKLTDFMLYIFTFWKATVRMSSPVPQSVTGEGEAAGLMADLLKGPVLPFATVFDNVESTVYDILVRKEGKWHVTKRPF